jgi:shikimate kinase
VIARSISQRPLVIELVGPAGAGKSTISRALTDRYRGLRTSIWSLPLPFLVLNGGRLVPTLLALHWQLRSLVWEESKHLVRMRTLHQTLGRRPAINHPLVILDEGPVFALSWLHVFGREALWNGCAETWLPQTLQQWVQSIDAVVVLEVPDPVLAQRLRSREKPHMVKDKTDEEIYEFSARFRTAFDRVISDLTVGGGPWVLTIHTGAESADQIAESLVHALKEKWNEL